MIKVRLCKVSDSCDNKGVVKNYESLDQCFKELMTPGNEYYDAALDCCDPPSFIIYKDVFKGSDFCVVAYDDYME